MSELRWILIGLGIILLAGIYLWGRRGQAPGADSVAGRVRSEPAMPPRELAAPDVPPADDASCAGDLSQTVPIRVEQRGVAQAAHAGPRVTATGLSGAELSERTARDIGQDSWRGRLEPTFGEAVPTQELPVHPEPAPSAPTLSSSETPAPRRIERRKILSLRLSFVPQRVAGDKLLETLLAESLEHGKYDVFHRTHGEGATLFSVASMVEPGTFEREKMAETLYPGITLFAQLPGPVPGMHSLNELVACARRLQQALGGTLQDERGVPLTVHRIERMRQEVREFERPPLGRGGGGPGAHA